MVVRSMFTFNLNFHRCTPFLAILVKYTRPLFESVVLILFGCYWIICNGGDSAWDQKTRMAAMLNCGGDWCIIMVSFFQNFRWYKKANIHTNDHIHHLFET